MPPPMTFGLCGSNLLLGILCPSGFRPERYLDTERGLCAVKLSGWIPQDVIDHASEEHERDLAEGVRIAYVAATRARDVLVIPGMT